MKCNVGSFDRAARIVIGAIIIAAGFYFKTWWGLIGVIPLATAFVGFCPLYRILGMSTCKKNKP
jgi:hypothetical protein